MKKYLYLKTVLFCLFIGLTIKSQAQQQFTHTAAKETISCNYDCTILDVAGLNNNPAAVIFVTPVLDKGVTQNPHPIGAYYFKNKWNIFNLDGKPIPEGAKFKVEYFTSPDDSHFQYSFTRADIQPDGSALIDDWHFNNNPTVRFNYFLSWDPATQGAITNREEITIQYNAAAGKWSVSNNNNKPMVARVTYNIAITWAGRVNTQATPPRTSTQINALTVMPNTNTFFGNVGWMFMSAWADGIKLPGDNLRTARLDQTEIYGLEINTTNLGVRKNTYSPITIKFLSGYPAGIPLLNAFIKKQSMSFIIEAVTTSQKTGKEEVNYTIKLTGAYISSYKQVFDKEHSQLISKNASASSYDEIKIIFTAIEVVNSAGTVTTDNF